MPPTATGTIPKPPAAPPPPRGKTGVRGFWQRLTEGLELQQLWSNFLTETRAGYSFYSRDAERHRATVPVKHERLESVKAFIWAILTKLSPARRVVLVVAVVLLAIPAPQNQPSLRFYAGLLLLLLLLLEIVDRVSMKRDLEIAREIQMWLVPESAPAVPGLDVAFTSRPANTVAGDYYDVLTRSAPDGSPRVLLTVADVVGKSIPAALLMATFQASLRTLCQTPAPLGELVQGVNRYACAHSQGGLRFTTAFFAELNPTTGELIYINAGHNAPMLRRPDGRLARLSAGGIPLGIDAGATYDSATDRMDAGDLLVIFTDGLVEAVNEAGQEYGEDRVRYMIQSDGTGTAGELLKMLMSQVDVYVGNARQHDDITCLVARRT